MLINFSLMLVNVSHTHKTDFLYLQQSPLSILYGSPPGSKLFFIIIFLVFFIPGFNTWPI